MVLDTTEGVHALLGFLVALSFEVDRIERLAAGDKEAVFHHAAETEIGNRQYGFMRR